MKIKILHWKLLITMLEVFYNKIDETDVVASDKIATGEGN